MPNKEDMRWFKQHFKSKIEPALEGTGFTIDLMTALACQETGEVWPVLRKTDLSVDRILELCVGDSRDANSKPPRKAFPATKAELLAEPRGQEMFDIARQSLVDMAQFIKGYRSSAKIKSKFSHGFGIFQFDLQFFRDEPDYFLQKRYANFDACLEKALGELKKVKNTIGFKNRKKLTDEEMAFVAIAYNIGPRKFKLSKGLKQGFRPKGGRFYGQDFFDFLQRSKTVEA
jgi:hypothetical protein